VRASAFVRSGCQRARLGRRHAGPLMALLAGDPDRGKAIATAHLSWRALAREALAVFSGGLPTSAIVVHRRRGQAQWNARLVASLVRSGDPRVTTSGTESEKFIAVL